MIETTGHPLPAALAGAVPLRIAELKALDDDAFEARRARAPELAQEIAEHGDELLYRVPGKSAGRFVTAVEAVALLAFAPGGVTIFGLHFEARR